MAANIINIIPKTAPDYSIAKGNPKIPAPIVTENKVKILPLIEPAAN